MDPEKATKEKAMTTASFLGAARRPAVFLLVAAWAAMAATAAVMATTPAAPALSEADRADIARIEAYLNTLTTVRARFMQMSSEGSYAEGDFYLSRPGHLRIEYDPPVPVLIVANGQTLVYYDKELEQTSYVGIDSTPAGLLVGAEVSFSGKTSITGFERGANALRLTLVMTEDPLGGSITLVVSDNPLVLRKWTVTDAQGVVTKVSLLGARFGMALDPELFRIKQPWDEKQE